MRACRIGSRDHELGIRHRGRNTRVPDVEPAILHVDNRGIDFRPNHRHRDHVQLGRFGHPAQERHEVAVVLRLDREADVDRLGGVLTLEPLGPGH